MNTTKMTDTQKLEFLLSKLQETADAFIDVYNRGKVEYARNLLEQFNLQMGIEKIEDKKWWVNEVGDLMWQPECPGPEWQLGKVGDTWLEWIDD
jgi:hypothetical protein